MEKIKAAFNRLDTSKIIALGFAGVILLGGLFLWMPFCAAEGQTTSFTDAMFTAATSVCVTGLTTVVTASHWNFLGKLIILFLIQIGGIGVISIATMFFVGLGKKISLKNRRVIQESYNLGQLSGIVKFVKRICLCIFGAEAIGAFCYAFCFIPEYGWQKGITYAVFTAISAFCNAGIDLFGPVSLAGYVTNPLVNFTTMGLIILSGIGFTVWWDIGKKCKMLMQKKLSIRRFYKTLSLHTKLALHTTIILLVGGTVLIFLFESKNPETLGNLSMGNKWMAAAFQSVTTRTAGFFTIDQAKFGNASALLCMLLMFIGGSPMGTAGGIKTTTIAVLVLNLKANLQGKRDTEFANRRIRSQYIRSALVVTTMGFLTLFFMSILLAVVVPQANLTDIVYEMTSAVATVGLSRGMTPMLPTAGKWIVIVTMFLGRIGPLTLGTAVLMRARKQSETMHLAEENIMIG